MQTFLIVYQDAVRVELWPRDSDWTMRMLGREETIGLRELGGALHVTDVYARVMV